MSKILDSLLLKDTKTGEATEYQIQDSQLKARVDNLIANAGNTDDNAELIDIRVGEDGTQYPTAGEAVRGQVSKLKSDLNAIKSFVEIEKITGRYVEIENGDLGQDGNYNVYVCNVYGLDAVRITPFYTTTKLTYAFYNAIGEFINGSSGTFASASENIISVPDDAHIIKFSSIIYKDAVILADWGKTLVVKDTVESISADVNELKEETTTAVLKRTGYADMNASNTGYLNTSGLIVSYANAYYSDFVPVKPLSIVAYKTSYIYAVSIAAAFYDSNKAFIAGSGIVAQSGTFGVFVSIEGTVTVPENARYMRFTMSKNTGGGSSYAEQYFSYTSFEGIKDYIISAINPWHGKNWCCFGTSITDTSYMNQETGEITGKYVPFLKNISGLNVTNRGIAGGTLGSGGIHGGSSSILNAILNSNDLDDFDLITIEGFVNDFACAITIGDIGDTQNTTFYGALHQAISYCLEHSHAEVVLITESTGKQYTLSGGTTADYRILYKNSLGLYQQAYNDAMIRIGQYYGIHVIDAGGKSQINQYHPEYIIDQIHHTTLGGEQYAKTIWEELKNIHPAEVASS